MELRITKVSKPPRLTNKARALFSDAETAGFKHLGWLTVTVIQPLTVAAFTNADGSIGLAFFAPKTNGPFEPLVIDMASHLEGPRKLTTTTFGVVAPQEERGIYKYSYPGARIGDLLKKHHQRTKSLKAKPVVFVKTLADFGESIREYLEYEMDTAPAPAPKGKKNPSTKSKPSSRKPKPNSEDPFSVIRAEGSAGPNYDISNEDIIERLSAWRSICSFRVMAASYDTVEIEFDTLPRDMDAFVRDLYKLCPDLVDQGTGCVHEFLELMEETGEKPSPEMQKLIEGVDFEDENYGLEILKRELVQKRKVSLWWD